MCLCTNRSINISLYANDEVFGRAEMVPNGAGEWIYTFKGLKKYEDGQAVRYSIGIDPIDGLTIIDAEDVETLKEMPAQSLVITQVYNQQIASDTKLMLMDLYPDEYEVTYIHNLALPDESIRQIPLYELDRQKDVDHLTSLFIRAKG